jgi:hypothetical protein
LRLAWKIAQPSDCSINQGKLDMNRFAIIVSLVTIFFGILSCSQTQERHQLDGRWKLDAKKSASIDPWGTLELEILVQGNRATLVKRYSAGHVLDRRTDSMTVNIEGREEILPVPAGRWLGQVSMGVYYGPGTQRYVKASANSSRTELVFAERELLQTAQGAIESNVTETFTLSPDGSTLQWSAVRSTRKSGPPLTYTFVRIAQ